MSLGANINAVLAIAVQSDRSSLSRQAAVTAIHAVVPDTWPNNKKQKLAYKFEWQVAVSLGRCNHRMLGPRGGFKPDKKSPGGWLLGRAGTEDRDEEPGLLTRNVP